jgi:hypothetical protein
MRTDSEILKSWTFAKKLPFSLFSYGANYDGQRNSDGSSAYTFGEECFYKAFEEENDLVVPTASALGIGEPRRLPGSCDHFTYFSRADVQQALRSL